MLMELQLVPSWKEALAAQLQQPYYRELQAFVSHAYATTTCYPPVHQILAAFNHTPFDAVKVVILGQDPYHGAGQGNGLCFSVNDGIKKPPSLINIFKELETDLNIPMPESGNLKRWANQGVLLLNAVLTVEEGKAASHKNKGWELFTDAVIQAISTQRTDVVFMLWGGFARGKKKLIDASKHDILESGHPSPLSANRGHWLGNRHFSKANAFLERKGKKGVEW